MEEIRQCIYTSTFSNGKTLLHATLLLILHFDIAQESRALSIEEHELRASLKRKIISLAMVEKARKKTKC
jgi:hypothetical protein